MKCSFKEFVDTKHRNHCRGVVDDACKDSLKLLLILSFVSSHCQGNDNRGKYQYLK